ncbi:hypothetical protein CHOCRA_000101 [Candidatus Hodgkinia cicadicola]|nr:hypothetical protein CHOCRA_000101 [Candidatus Hodgkinia cicadicola]
MISKYNWFWEKWGLLLTLRKCQCIFFDNTQCEYAYIACYQKIYIGICAKLTITPTFPKINFFIDNFSNALILFNLNQPTKIKASVNLKSKLTINFKTCSSINLYIIADKAARINILFINMLSRSNVKTILKLRTRARSLVYSKCIVANYTHFNVLKALTLGKNAKLKVMYEIIIMSNTPLLILPQFSVRDIRSLLVHAININCLNYQVYSSNRLIASHLLAALNTYTLCTTLLE